MRYLSAVAAGLLACTIAVSNVTAAVVTEWVEIGDPGNLEHTVLMKDFTTGYGSVGYEFRMGKFEVTNAEYIEFLSAVATTDTHGLYSTSMQTFVFGGITRSGSPGNRIYALKSNMSNKPVNFVKFFDAARYANWLHNGQPTGIQDASTTEDGAYTFTGTEIVGPRNPGALVYLPNEHEWHKAAFYAPGVVTDDGDEWWLYSTQNDTTPTQATADAVGNISNPGPNVSSHRIAGVGADWNGTTGGNVLSVGTSGSETFYGAQDMGGSVFEWVEADPNKVDPYEAGPYQVRGGSFFSDTGHQRSTERNNGPKPGDGDTDGRDFLTWQRGVGPIVDRNSLFSNFDNNLVVDGDDLAIWQSAFGLSTDGDADIDGEDGHFHNDQNKAVGFRVAAIALPLAAVAVPEPSAFALCCFAAVIAAGARRPAPDV